MARNAHRGAGRGAGGGEGDSIPFPPHDSPGPDRRPLPHSLTYAGGPPHPIAEARGLRRRFDQSADHGSARNLLVDGPPDGKP